MPTPNDKPKSLLSQWNAVNSTQTPESKKEDTQIDTQRYVPSEGQKRLYFLTQLHPDNPVYNLSETWKIRGYLDTEALVEAWKQVGRQQDLLRSTFVMEDGEIYCQIQESFAFAYEYADYTHLKDEELTSAIHSLSKQKARFIYDLEKGPLSSLTVCKLAEDHYWVLVNMHHIISDKWSMRILRKSLSMAYQSIISDESKSDNILPSLAAQYAHYVHETASQPINQSTINYWKDKLKEANPTTIIAPNTGAYQNSTFEGKYTDKHVPSDLFDRIKSYCKEQKTTSFIFFLSLFKLLIHKYSSEEDIVLGTPISTRSKTDYEDIVGFFNDTIVLRTQLEDELTFTDLLSRAKSTVLDAFKHKEIGFQNIINEVNPERSADTNPLFQMMFLFHQDTESTRFADGITLKPENFDIGVAKFDLTLYVSESATDFDITIEYATDLYTEDYIQRFLDHYISLMQHVLADPETPVNALAYISESERAELFTLGQGPQISLPDTHTIIDEIFSNASATDIALIDESQSYTYDALDKKSNQIANTLINHTPKHGIVAILMEQTADFVVSMLGVLKAGLAYLPLDSTYPAEHLHKVIKSSGIDLMITTTNHEVAQYNCESILYEEISGNESNPDLTIKKDDPAYVIFTSGSTGTPNAAVISHANLMNSTRARLEYYDQHPSAYLMLSSFSFDSSIAGIYWTLINGGKLVIPRKESTKDLDLVSKLIAKEEISHSLMIPSLYQTYLEFIPAQVLSNLQVLILAGEVLSPNVASTHLQQQPTVRLYNEYGPTEATVWASAYEVTAATDLTNIPIGKPIANSNLYLLDKDHNLIPRGMAGQLYIGGDSVTNGYLDKNNPKNDKFIFDEASQLSKRLYRTGDWAKWDADGNLIFLGRRDNQIKIRGHRIELGEIDAIVNQYQPEIKSTTIYHKERNEICCFVESQEEVNTHNLASYLAEKLPKHYQPDQLIHLQEYPLMPNGKVDTKALKASVQNRKKTIVSHNTLTPKEQQLLGIWQEVLSEESIGVGDNFFELGGDSIQVIRLVAKARKQGINISPKDLYSHQTIKSLANQLTDDTAVKSQALLWDQLPLSPIQEWFFDTYNANHNHWWQSYQCLLNTPISKKDFTDKVSQVLQSHEIFNTIFFKEYGKWFHKRKRFAAEDYFFKEGQDCDIDITQGPLIKVAITSDNEMVTGAQIIAHHLVIDAVSWSHLLDQINDVLGGKTPSEQQSQTDYFKWINRINQLSTTALYDKQVDYWDTILEKESKFFSQYTPGTEGDVKTLFTSVKKSTLDTLRRKGTKVSDFKIDELIIGSFIQVYQEQTQETGLTLMVERHGRKANIDGVDLTNSIGWHTTYYPVYLEVTAPSQALQSMSEVKDQLRQVPDDGVSYGVLQYLSHKLKRPARPTVIINHLGEQEASDYDNLVDVRFVREGMRAAESERDCLIEINSWIKDGKLEIGYSYDGSNLQYAEMQVWLDRLVETLEQSAQALDQATPFKTISDYKYRLTKADLVKVNQHVADNNQHLSQLIDLTATQSAILFHHLQNPSSDQGLIVATVDLTETIDRTILQQAWDTLTNRHDSLRSHFVWEGLSAPLQVILEEITSPIEYVNVDGDQIDKTITDWKNDPSNLSLDLGTAPPNKLVCFEYKPSECSLLLVCHHISLDGWSTSNLFSDLMKIYNGLANKKPATLPEITTLTTWKDTFDTVRDEYQSLDFWNAYLRNLQPSKLKVGNTATYTFESTVHTLSSEESTDLMRSIQDSKITINNYFIGIWSWLLSQYLQRNQVVVGLTQSGRSLPVEAMDQLVGMFSSVLPVKINHLQDHEIDFLGLQETLNEILVRDAVSLEDLKLDSSDLFDTLVIVENFAPPESTQEGLSYKNFSSDISTTVPLCLVIVPGDKIKVSLRYNAALYSQAEISQLNNDLLNLLENIKVTEGKAKIDISTTFVADQITSDQEMTSPTRQSQLDDSLSLEQSIKIIWEDTLEVNDIQLDDDFFDIGGKSIQAVRIFNRINERFGLNVSPILLLKHKTIRALATQLSGDDNLSSWECVYPLKEEGHLPPVFCFHAGEGHIMFYKEFAEAMDPNRPVYGIQPIGLDGSKVTFESIAQMAQFYVEKIKEKYPSGPYHLLGTCFSNAVTFEIAKLLESETGVIYIIDSPPPHFKEFSKLSKWLNWVVTFNLPKLREAFSNYFKYSNLKAPTDAQSQHLFNTGKQLRELMSRYQWSPQEISISLIRSSQNANDKFKNYHIDNWELLAMNGVTSQTIDGTHLEIFQGQSAVEMATSVSNTLIDYES